MFDLILFFTSAILTVIGAILVVATKDIMHACVYLLVSFLGVSGLYLTLGADFVAAIQLVVYVGGVVILMVFAVMLTGGPHAQKQNKFGIVKTALMGNMRTYTVGGLIGALVLLMMVKLYLSLFKIYTPKELPEYLPTVERIGKALITDHVLAFEISSVLLLGALIGAAIIARPRKNRIN
ncbi:MAG: NADH-quinone oxidoreductase subunit J [Deltaproteobacteria bacterium]|nr:MAG: NADH-quinone oxidoreductase subunit J [Deltaproteobacteria bacterium]